MTPFLIRRLSPNDAGVFREIRLEGLRDHPDAFGADFEEERKRTKEWFADRLTTNLVFGGFDKGDDLCGVIAVACSQSAKTRHIATIWGMYVRKVARGTGLSKSLLDLASQHAFEHCQSIRLTVAEANHAARRLYSAAGFREWAKDTAALKVGDLFHDES